MSWIGLTVSEWVQVEGRARRYGRHLVFRYGGRLFVGGMESFLTLKMMSLRAI